MPKKSFQNITNRLADTAVAGDCISDADARGLRLIVSPAGMKRFVVAYKKPDGRHSMKALGRYPVLSIKEAREKANKIRLDAERGIDPLEVEREEKEAPRLRDLCSLYLDDYAVHQNLSPKTIQDTRSVLQPVLKAKGTTRVADINIGDIRKLHGDARVAGIERGNKGVYRANRMLAALSKMFSLGIERGWVKHNPCKGVKKFPEDERWRNLSEDEISRLLSACEDYTASRPEYSMAQGAVDAIFLLLFTGARLRELLRAQWSQFDLERGQAGECVFLE